MNTFLLTFAAAIGGYAVGFLGGLGVIEAFSPNTHDRSLEAAMTGAFVIGPLMAVTAVVVVLIYRSRRSA